MKKAPMPSDDELRTMLGAVAVKQFSAAGLHTRKMVKGAVVLLKARWPRLTTNAAMAAISAASIYISPGG
jgi:hypothetical protein